MTNSKKVEVYECELCRKVYFQENVAELCCQNKTCATDNCDNEPECNYILCSGCFDKKIAEKRKRIIEKAKTESYYHGPCFDYEGNFYQDAESWEDQQEEPAGEWLFVAKKILYFGAMDALSLIDRFVENADIEDTDVLASVKGIKEFSEAVEKFQEANKGLYYWTHSFKEKFWVESE